MSFKYLRKVYLEYPQGGNIFLPQGGNWLVFSGRKNFNKPYFLRSEKYFRKVHVDNFREVLNE